MNKKSDIYYFLTLILFLASSSSFSSGNIASGMCNPQEVNDPEVSGRAKKVIFPNGRSITVVGHIHGTRQFTDIEQKIESGELSKMSNAEFSKYLRSILTENTNQEHFKVFSIKGRQERKKELEKMLGQELGIDPSQGYDLNDVSVLSHAKQDKAYLEKVSGFDGGFRQIEFVGFEGTMNTWLWKSQHDPLVIRQFLNEFNKRKANINISNQELRDILISSMNGNVALYGQNPELQRIIPMIGVESEQAASFYYQKDPLERLEAFKKELIKIDNALSFADQEKLQNNKKFKLFFYHLITTLSDIEYMRISTLEDLNKKIKNIYNMGASFPSFLELLPTLTTIGKDRIEANNKRDSASAYNLALENKSGVHFVGLNHLKGIVGYLKDICHSELHSTFERNFSYTGTIHSDGNFLKSTEGLGYNFSPGDTEVIKE